MSDALLHTPLYVMHTAHGARMVPFAGYAMPVQYPLGVLKEHLHTRAAAGLFDVSHMGQLKLRPLRGTLRDAALALESLLPMDYADLLPFHQRYGFFTNQTGGILDDLMVTNAGDYLYVVVNAACKAQDTALLQEKLRGAVSVEVMRDYALLALQGPQAVQVMQRLLPAEDFGGWLFMTSRIVTLVGVPCLVSRSGYTGEDGFEISIHEQQAQALANLLLEQTEVELIGLGARDSLRLEAGLCLYGHDLNEETTPVAAALTWAISKARRSDGARPGGFPGAEIVLKEINEGAATKRVGLLGKEKTPVREGAYLQDATGNPVGRVCSGSFAPSLGMPIAMAYVDKACAAMGNEVFAEVRGKLIPMTVQKMPFYPAHYYRG